MLEERGRTTRSPSVRLLTAEVRRLWDKGARDQEWIDRFQGDLAAAQVEVMKMRAEVERLSILASVTTSEALSGVAVGPDVAARLLAEEERDEARAERERLRAALTRALNQADAYRQAYAESQPSVAECFDDIAADLEAALQWPT